MPRDTRTSPIRDHERRYELANELHARPFPSLAPPSHAAYLAIKRAEDAASRDREEDRAHLIALLDRHGASHPSPGATHWYGQIGRHRMKWEAHTEFVTYTLFGDGVAERAFDGSTFSAFPEDWLAEAPGVRMTSALVRIQPWPGEEAIASLMSAWFVPESLAASRVLDDSAVIAGDFRIDENGHTRFAVFVGEECEEQRVGRIVQRLCEIETYKTMSMLGFARVRAMGPDLTRIDQSLTTVMGDMTGGLSKPDATLKALLEVSAELEALGARSSYRFAATAAYEAIVSQRIEVLREERFGGRQTFAEFMMRRYDPAMRTVKASQDRISAMSERASRASDLLRTRVDVERSAQNQSLLESMDKRADLQLRLQKTVEGLSVVAISYYAVNLLIYMLEPVAAEAGMGKLILTSVVTPLTVLGVWWMVRRIRKQI